MTTDEPDRAGMAAPVGRRTVLRTGAHLAWAVPAISLVTAVPAVACSGPTTFTLHVETHLDTFDGNQNIQWSISYTVCNTTNTTQTVTLTPGVNNPAAIDPLYTHVIWRQSGWTITKSPDGFDSGTKEIPPCTCVSAEIKMTVHQKVKTSSPAVQPTVALSGGTYVLI